MIRQIWGILAVCLTTALLAQAQFGPSMGAKGKPPGEGKIQGIVVDSITGEPVSFASIVIQEALERRDVDGSIADEKGRFSIVELKNARYLVIASFLGYQTKILGPFKINKDSLEHQLGEILLAPNATLLSEVEVVGAKDMVEQKIDRIIYNASRDVTSRGGTAADVLRRTPLLTVDLEGNVSMQGSSNIKVLINGKPSTIMSSSIADAVKMIPADVIDRVEVITSPGAKYDAEGTGGIINIVTKTKKIQGVSGSVNMSAGTKSSNLGTNLNIRMGKIGFNTNIGGFYWRGKGTSEIDRENLEISTNPYYRQEGKSSNNGGGLFAQLSADYDIDAKNSLVFSARFPLNRFANDNDLTTYTGDDKGQLPFLFRRASDVVFRRLGTDLNLDYRKTFDKDSDKEFSMSAQYSYTDRKSDYETDQFSESGALNYREVSPNLGSDREIIFAADYLHPLSKAVTAEGGAKAIFRNVFSDIFYDTLDLASQQYLRDLSRNNTFDYDQNVAAAYGQISFPITAQLKARAGLRYEHTFIDGLTQSDGNQFENDYASWVPSGLLAWTLPDRSTLKFSYNRRIQRPSMYFLNPYVNYNDPTNISYGNPELKPEVTESLELSYGFAKGTANGTFSIYHKATSDLIDNYRFVDSLGRTNATYNNLAQGYSSGISINGGIMKLGKIMLNGNLNLYYQKVESSEFSDSRNDAFSYSFNGFANVNITPTLGILFFGFLNSPKLTTQGKQSSWFMYSIGLRRDLWKKMGGISVSVDNIFHPELNLGASFRSSSLVYEADNRFEGWGVRVSLDYRFGKMEFGSNSKKRKGRLNDDLKQGDSDGGPGR
ncbi:MAG: Vitamin B12 transporter BtuB [Saprospiraceae bacterium]|jgi:ferric enterobactin receptor|nr:Vitamin B12 transporter BtuB [Saprospiraceae bacterium]